MPWKTGNILRSVSFIWNVEGVRNKACRYDFPIAGWVVLQPYVTTVVHLTCLLEGEMNTDTVDHGGRVTSMVLEENEL
jgi:hypothetical protein